MDQSLSNAKPDGSTAPAAATAPHRSRSATPRRTSELTLGDGREACSAAVAIETTHTETIVASLTLSRANLRNAPSWQVLSGPQEVAGRECCR